MVSQLNEETVKLSQLPIAPELAAQTREIVSCQGLKYEKLKITKLLVIIIVLKCCVERPNEKSVRYTYQQEMR